MSTTEVLVGREPIFDAALEVTGYRLTVRDSEADIQAGGGVPTGTSSALAAALTAGIERVVGGRTVFYPAPVTELRRAVPLLLPPERIVVVVRIPTPGDGESVTDTGYAIRALRMAGYRVALDAFDWFTGADELLSQAAIVALDVATLGLARTVQLAEHCAQFDVARLATNVSSAAELRTLREQNFEFLHGYALARPTTVRGTGLDASALGALQVAAVVLDRDADPDEIVRIVRRDPALAIQLLQVASLGRPGQLRRPARSIREAVVLMGTRRLRSWVTLLALSSSTAAPPDQLITALFRARMCELLADPADAPFAFMAGMVSALDRLLGIPVAELTTMLPLDAELLTAAFDASAEEGQLVRRVIQFESGAGDDPDLAAVAELAFDWAMQSSELLEAV